METKHVHGKKAFATARQKKQHYREKKYKKSFGNRSEGQGFADRIKQKAVHQYNKLLRKEEARQKHSIKNKPQPVIETQEASEDKKPRKKFNAIKKAQQEYKAKLAEETKRKNQIAERKKQQEDALEKYQKTKKEKYKLICKKNFRGQPKVAGQMAILLDRIQASQNTG